MMKDGPEKIERDLEAEDRLTDIETSRIGDDLIGTKRRSQPGASLITDVTDDTGLLAGADDEGDEAPDFMPLQDEETFGTADYFSDENTAGLIDTRVEEVDPEDLTYGDTDLYGDVIGAGPGTGTRLPIDTGGESLEPGVRGATRRHDPTAEYEMDDEVLESISNMKTIENRPPETEHPFIEMERVNRIKHSGREHHEKFHEHKKVRKKE